MTSRFSIDVSWLPGCVGPPEVRDTAAILTITIGDAVATRVEDTWAKTVQPATRVSVYPLALWIASSWWRLRWESRPFRTAPDLSWRMAHEMPASGRGFLWPALAFDSDGEEVTAISRPSSPLSDEPFRYLADFQENIEASVFERTVDAFLKLVLARLEAVGIKETHLQSIWEDLEEERKDSALSRRRKIEAQLGFEPDDAPNDLLDRLDQLSFRAGAAAVEELAPVCAGVQPEHVLAQIEQFAELPGREGHIALPSFSAAYRSEAAVPWERGRELAKLVRKACGLGSGPIVDRDLAGFLKIPEEELQRTTSTGIRPPVGLAIRNGDDGRVKLLFRKRNGPALRFEAARFLAEMISAPETDHWLPTTDSTTARQKVQRAFAAEFLAPIEALRDFLKGDFSTEAIEVGSEYFGVSELAVKSHLANHGDIPPNSVLP